VKFQSCFRKLNSLEVPHVVVSSSLLRGLRGQGFGVRRIEHEFRNLILSKDFDDWGGLHNPFGTKGVILQPPFYYFVFMSSLTSWN
jgi:hypothetical protein